MNIKIEPSKLCGEIIVPPSKSLSHRAIICASLGEENSIIKNLVLSDDIKATIEGMKQLGAEIKFQDKDAHIKRNNTPNLNPIINCKESGSTLRFLIPISMAITNNIAFTGTNKLFERPLDVYFNIFDNQEIKYTLTENSLYINNKIKPGYFEIPGNISSQFISGLLFTLPLLYNNSEIKVTENYESQSYVHMTLDVMKKFGIHIDESNNTYFIPGNQKYKSTIYTVEGDYSQAAFFLVANDLGSNVTLSGLKNNSLQGDKEIISIIEKYKTNNKVEIDASQIPDLVPIISVLAALKKNCRTVIRNAARLRIKESDRLKAMSTELNKLGALVHEREDGLIIEGKETLEGNATVNSWNDHRIAMALAIAATKCENHIILENHMTVNKSYPDFWNDYKSLGGLYELNNRQ